ncbi:MAG: discoidin domain-containing protein [Candidatus Woesearchaeota archaeon]
MKKLGMKKAILRQWFSVKALCLLAVISLVVLSYEAYSVSSVEQTSSGYQLVGEKSFFENQYAHINVSKHITSSTESINGSSYYAPQLNFTWKAAANTIDIGFSFPYEVIGGGLDLGAFEDFNYTEPNCSIQIDPANLSNAYVCNPYDTVGKRYVWTDITSLITHFSYGGKEYYLLQNIDAAQNQLRMIRLRIPESAVPRGTSVKYDIVGKLSRDSIGTALSTGRYIDLDPLISVGRVYWSSGYVNGGYSDTNGVEFTDGNYPGGTISNAAYFGVYSGSSVQANWTVDLGAQYDITNINITALEDSGNGVYCYPIMLLGSNDNVTFTPFGNKVDPSGNGVKNYTWDGLTASYRYIRMNLTISGSPRFEFLQEFLIYGTESTSYANESQGDTAIEAGIISSLGVSATKYSEQQVYVRNLSNNQTLGRFDWVAASGSKRWLLNYITTGQSYVRAPNLTNAVYVLEMINKTSAQITNEVSLLINWTK